MPGIICPKCGAEKEVKKPWCKACYNKWQNERKRLNPQKRTPEQRVRQNFMERQRIAGMTPEEKQAYHDRKNKNLRKFMSDPEVRLRRNAEAAVVRSEWTPERRGRQKETHKVHYDKLKSRLSQGLCGHGVSCSEPPIGDQRDCLFHWCNGVRHVQKDRVSCTTEELVSLWKKQDGKCAVLGTPIIPGRNAELDHIVPIGKGGGGGIENLRYVHGWFNRMKWRSTDEELKSLLIEHGEQLIRWSKNIS